jgi:hypothetical protein
LSHSSEQVVVLRFELRFLMLAKQAFYPLSYQPTKFFF